MTMRAEWESEWAKRAYYGIPDTIRDAFRAGWNNAKAGKPSHCPYPQGLESLRAAYTFGCQHYRQMNRPLPKKEK